MMKKLTALLLSFMMILSNFVPVITFAQENSGRDDNYEYIGYQDGSTGITNKLYVEKKGDPSGRRIVYCFNQTLHWPDTKGTTNNLAYKKTTGSVLHPKS